MNQNFLYLYFLLFYSAVAIIDCQFYVVVEHFGAESISLLSGCLVWTPMPLQLQWGSNK